MIPFLFVPSPQHFELIPLKLWIWRVVTSWDDQVIPKLLLEGQGVLRQNMVSERSREFRDSCQIVYLLIWYPNRGRTLHSQSRSPQPFHRHRHYRFRNHPRQRVGASDWWCLSCSQHIQLSTNTSKQWSSYPVHTQLLDSSRTSLYTCGPVGGANWPWWTYRARFLNLFPRFVSRSIELSESESVVERLSTKRGR